MNRKSAGLVFLAAMGLIVIIFAIVAIFAVRNARNGRGESDSSEGELLALDGKNQELQDTVNRTLFVLANGGEVYFTEVLVYYPESKRGFVVDVPGNTGSIYKSLNRVDRIDAVYREKGIEVFRDEIAKVMGFSDDRNTLNYIEMTLDNFKRLTDLLGGLKIFIPAQVDIASENGDRWLLPSGAVALDGDKIHTYLDYEDSEEKYEPFEERRKNVMVSLLSAFSRNAKYMNDDRRSLLYAGCLRSDLDENDLREFLREVSRGDFEGLKPMSITGRERGVEGVEGRLLFPEFDGQDIKRVVKLKTTSLISSMGENLNRIYVLEIQNGTRVTGLAHNTAIYYRGAGYDVLNVTNADNDEYEKTVIISHIGELEIAKSVGSYIRCSNIIEETVKPEGDDSDVKSNVDFTIILGRDFDGRYVR